MSLRAETPCDYGTCPYEAEYHYTCEYWCGAEEPQDVAEWFDEGDEELCLEEDELDYEDELDAIEMGYDPYLGCYTDDC